MASICGSRNTFVVDAAGDEPVDPFAALARLSGAAAGGALAGSVAADDAFATGVVGAVGAAASGADAFDDDVVAAGGVLATVAGLVVVVEGIAAELVLSAVGTPSLVVVRAAYQLASTQAPTAPATTVHATTPATTARRRGRITRLTRVGMAVGVVALRSCAL